MSTDWKSIVHGGMCAVMLANNAVTNAQAQQGVNVIVNQGNVGAFLHVCGSYTSLSMSTQTSLQMISGVNAKVIYVCDFEISNSSGTASAITLNIGTGTNCATNSSVLGGTWYAGSLNWGKIAANPYYRGLNSAAVGSSELCVNSTVTTTFSIGVYYDQY